MQQINKLVKSEIENHSGNASRAFIVGLNQGCCIGLASYFKLDTSLGALGGIFVRRVADYLEQWDMTREV